MGIQNKVNENVSSHCFSLKNVKTDANQPISRNRIENRIECFWALYLQKRENWCKALYIGKEKDFARKVYNECFIVQKNHKANNTKTRVYGEISYTPKCCYPWIILLIEKQNNLTKCVYF